jgi:hypothetical protein
VAALRSLRLAGEFGIMLPNQADFGPAGKVARRIIAVEREVEAASPDPFQNRSAGRADSRRVSSPCSTVVSPLCLPCMPDAHKGLNYNVSPGELADRLEGRALTVYILIDPEIYCQCSLRAPKCQKTVQEGLILHPGRNGGLTAGDQPREAREAWICAPSPLYSL